jgi:16S rRNA C1402 (ribose-2'-O) methylase RsmI
MSVGAYRIHVLKSADAILAEDLKRAESYFARYGKDFKTEAAHRHKTNHRMATEMLPHIGKALLRSWAIANDEIDSELLAKCEGIVEGAT